MNNGDSFHNGPENLELQRKNRLGIQDLPSDSAAGNPTDSTPPPIAPITHSIESATVVGTKNNIGTPYYESPTANPAYAFGDGEGEAEQLQRKNKFNVASLVLGISSFAGNLVCLFCLTPIAAILAIVFGCMGRVGGKFNSKGLVGMILGIVYFVLFFLLFALVILAAALGLSEAPGAVVA